MSWQQKSTCLSALSGEEHMPLPASCAPSTSSSTRSHASFFLLRALLHASSSASEFACSLIHKTTWLWASTSTRRGALTQVCTFSADFGLGSSSYAYPVVQLDGFACVQMQVLVKTSYFCVVSCNLYPTNTPSCYPAENLWLYHEGDGLYGQTKMLLVHQTERQRYMLQVWLMTMLHCAHIRGSCKERKL